MKKTMGDAFKDHYEKIHLSPRQLASLRKLQEPEHKPSSPSPFRFYGAWALGLAAALFLVLFTLYFIEDYRWSRYMEKVADEVILNHIKNLEPDVHSASLNQVRNMLPKLDFNLIDSAQPDNAHLTLEGGRYCSIQGRLAAQLRLKREETGQRFTLYQIPSPGGLAILKERVFSRDGLTVRIWMEKGLLLAMAGEEQPANRSPGLLNK